eukprot:gene4007-4556_t
MAIESDLLVPGDRGTMEVIKSIGNSIHPSIQLEIDCPSNHDDRKMPSLDLKLHVRDVGGAKKIVHEFYAKVVWIIRLNLVCQMLVLSQGCANGTSTTSTWRLMKCLLEPGL